MRRMTVAKMQKILDAAVAGTVPKLRPSHVLRMVKAKKLHPGGGRCACANCLRVDSKAVTESPDFWENGSYTYCPWCKRMALAIPVFPPCNKYPAGYVIDLSGERKKYPLVLEDSRL